jgi:two-component system sensor histidine kinase PhoQ
LISGIQSRLLLTTAGVLAVVLSLTGWVLDSSFRASQRAGAQQQLMLVIYSLMGSAQEHEDHVDFTDELPEPRLSQPESGLYAFVTGSEGERYWRSPSAETTAVRYTSVQPLPGEFQFATVDQSRPMYVLSYSVIWEDADESLLTFQVATDQAPFRMAVQGFRRSLYLGIGGVTLVFIIAQMLAIRWGLRPLRSMQEEVRQLEAGARQRLSAGYPRELTGLASNLDRFVAHEERSRTRYRNALDDLAHSLKTPLAVIRNALREQPGSAGELVDEQLQRMESAVTHQLSRAVTGPVVVGGQVDLTDVIERILRALKKAYLDRDVSVESALPEALVVRGDERDYLEIFGNLLENAFKYTHHEVRISAVLDQRVHVVVEDDGPGISEVLREEVRNRGTRADRVQQGQGIGLAVVAELVGAYQGTLEIGASGLGGARIEVVMPG